MVARACVDSVVSWRNGCECGGWHGARAVPYTFGEDGGGVLYSYMGK